MSELEKNQFTYRGKLIKDMSRTELEDALITMGSLYNKALSENIERGRERIEGLERNRRKPYPFFW